jgi:hypothetical protein
MDCKTARLLLDFARPQACELGPEETGALESHLEQCADCHGLARAERGLDDCLGKAMRQVEVPAGLRDRLQARLEADRGDWYRRRFAHTMRLAAAAAALLLFTWGAGRWVLHHSKPFIDPQQIADAVNNGAMQDPRTRIETELKRMGVETALPPQLNYNLVIAPASFAELPGFPNQQAAMLVFSQNGRFATVYLISTEQLRDGVPLAVGGATFKVDVLPSAGEPYTFLVVHDGDNLDWLRPPELPTT